MWQAEACQNRPRHPVLLHQIDEQAQRCADQVKTLQQPPPAGKPYMMSASQELNQSPELCPANIRKTVSRLSTGINFPLHHSSA